MRLAKLGWWRLVVVAVALAGCGKGSAPAPVPPPVEPVVLDVVVDADGTGNPDIAGRASPVTVKILQLRTAGGFEAGDFFALNGTAATVLGPDLVASQETSVRPGEHKKLEETLDPRTRFVGIMAGFRDLENASWRAVVSVPAKGPPHQTLGVRLNRLTVLAAFVEPKEPSGNKD
jgi:type VI secretion system protein VasD